MMRQIALDHALLKGPVAVLMGGLSAEREVSLLSGRAVFEALRHRLPDLVLIDAGEDLLPQLQAHGIRHAFIALHGAVGENGTLQGALELMGISYTGSGVLASALAMDKLRCKRFWQGEGIATPDFDLLLPGSRYAEVAARLGPELVLKPASEGSSLGIAMVTDALSFDQALQSAFGFDDVVLAEKRVVGPEYTVGFVGQEILPSIRLETSRVFYDYEAKYEADDTRYLCPSQLSAEDERTLAALARRAYESLGCRGWGRVDVMRDQASGVFEVLEVNTSPGMTSHSLVPMAAMAAGLDFENLVVAILNDSLRAGQSA